MPDFTVVIPGKAPRLNDTYKVNVRQNRRVYKDPDVALWQDTAAWLVKAARPRDWKPAKRVMVTIECYTPGPHPRDSDAQVKATLDALAVGLGVDDKIFLHCVPVNEVDRAAPRTVIHVENVGDPA